MTGAHYPEFKSKIMDFMRVVGHDRKQQWQLFGIGLLRLNFGRPGHEQYLHIFDDTFKTKDVTEMHDHPFVVNSMVVAGCVAQRTLWSDKPHHPRARAVRLLRRPLPDGEDVEVRMYMDPEERIDAGGSYDIPFGCAHLSYPVRGTVTTVEPIYCGARTPPTFSYRELDKPYVPVSSRTPTEDEVDKIVDYSLSRWF